MTYKNPKLEKREKRRQELLLQYKDYYTNSLGEEDLVKLMKVEEEINLILHNEIGEIYP